MGLLLMEHKAKLNFRCPVGFLGWGIQLFGMIPSMTSLEQRLV